jgi:hypothetical protein
MNQLFVSRPRVTRQLPVMKKRAVPAAVLVVLLALAILPLASALGEQASAVGNCRSVSMDVFSGYVPGLGQVDNYVTTFDGQSGVPLYQPLPNGYVLFSGELRPRSGQSGVYEADYVTYDDQGDAQDYGSFIGNLPSTDSDGNGLPDVVQRNKAVNASVSGTTISDYYGTSSSFTGSLYRPANSITGSYSVTLTRPGQSSITYNGVLYLLNLSGSVSYSRATAVMNLSLSQTLPHGGSRTLSGTTFFNVINVNQVALQQFNVNSSDGYSYTVLATTLNRSGNTYTGNVQLADGLPDTYWPDYVNWVFEITDPNDSDGDGIPNLSDQVQPTPTPTPIPTPTAATILDRAVIGLVANANNLYVTAENAGASPLIANRNDLGLWEQFQIQDQGNGYIAIKSLINGKFVSANTGASALIANQNAVGVSEQFKLLDAGNGKFALLAKVNDKYVVAENAGMSSLIANRDTIGQWEPLTIFVTLKAVINNKIVVAENAGNSSLIANRTAIGVWEQFQFFNAPTPGYFALKAKANSMFVCAENAGNSSLIANRTAIGVWEQFQWIAGGNGNIAIKALVNGLFVTAESAGNSALIANRPSAQSWEQFQ